MDSHEQPWWPAGEVRPSPGFPSTGIYRTQETRQTGWAGRSCASCEIKTLAVSPQLLFTVWAHIRKQFVFAHFLTEELARLPRSAPRSAYKWPSSCSHRVGVGAGAWGETHVLTSHTPASPCLSYVRREFLLKSQTSLFRCLNTELFCF